jgi:hypothetical protein
MNRQDAKNAKGRQEKDTGRLHVPLSPVYLLGVLAVQKGPKYGDSGG